MNTNTTEPVLIFMWDIHRFRDVGRAMVHFGTRRTVARLRRLKRLPTFRQVQDARRDGYQSSKLNE